MSITTSDGRTFMTRREAQRKAQREVNRVEREFAESERRRIEFDEMIARMRAARKLEYEVDTPNREYREETEAFGALVRRCENIQRRCLDSRHKDYRKYGQRGIWFGFRNAGHMAWYVKTRLGYAPPGTTLDRIDNDKGYEPDNLHWSTDEEQKANRRCSPRYAHRKGQGIRPSIDLDGVASEWRVREG